MLEMNFEKRIDKLIKLIEQKELDAVILGGRANIRYFTGLRFNTAAFSILFVSKDRDIEFLIPVLDYKRVKKTCWIKNIKKFPEDDPNYLKPLEQILAGRDIKRIGVEFSQVNMERETLIKKETNAQLINVESDLLRLRAIKDKQEIELIRISAQIADKAMNEAIKSLRPGIKEYQISAIAQDVMMKSGAEGLSFEPFVMTGENAWLPQRFSTEKEFKKGELAIFDMGCIYKGYCSDITRTFSLGDLSEKQKHLFKTAYESQQEALKALKPGVIAEDIHKIAKNVAIQNGYGDFFPHLTGHGIGLDEHEEPIIDEGRKMILEPGMVVTIEPGIYVEGVGAARIEDMVLITDTGYELLTNTPRDLINC